MTPKRITAIFALALSAAPMGAWAARLKDVASLEGVRDNQLIGYGLVVGLAGTGDKRQTVFSMQSLANMLERMGVSVPGNSIRVTNTAAVMVTATLPPFARSGAKIDVTTSAIGDASNLQGGTLLMTQLRGADGQVYAVAQGAVVTGGFAAGGGGNSKTVNHPTAGRVANGALVERAAPSTIPNGPLHWQLRQSDFTTAARIATAVNARFHDDAVIARAENPALVSVKVPAKYAGREIEFISELETVKVETDSAAKVVVNERTGTIVLGRDVSIQPVSLMHGALSVAIETTYQVSQPNPLGGGSTQVVPKVNVNASEEKAKSVSLPKGATVEVLVKALNSIGATPRDIIAILQNLKAAGALDADLEVI